MIKSIAIHHHLFNIPATPSLFLVTSAMPGLWKGDKAGWPGECGVYRNAINHHGNHHGNHHFYGWYSNHSQILGVVFGVYHITQISTDSAVVEHVGINVFGVMFGLEIWPSFSQQTQKKRARLERPGFCTGKAHDKIIRPPLSHLSDPHQWSLFCRIQHFMYIGPNEKFRDMAYLFNWFGEITFTEKI